MDGGILYAADPPPGVERDPSAAGDNLTLNIVSGIFFPLAVIFTIGRMYTRAVLVRTVSLDDCMFLGHPRPNWAVVLTVVDLMIAALVRP